MTERQKALWATALIGLALLLLPFVAGALGNAWIRILAFALLYVMLALGLNIVVGYAGLLDLGYVAFYAVGAYLYALLSSPHLVEHFPWVAAAFPDGIHLSIWIVIPLAAAVAALFGVLLGFPVLGLRGDYLAIVTLGFGEIIRIFLNNLNAPINLTNGPQGINTRDIKLLAFAMGASFGGVSGAMFSAFQGFVSPESFVLMESIVIVAMVVLGGMGNVKGVVLGAVLLYAIPEALRHLARPIQLQLLGQEWIAPEALRMLLFGMSMVLIMLYRPLGLIARPHRHAR
jgi:ABC-type branched-subunit amino acid transport system permease subunit